MATSIKQNSDLKRINVPLPRFLLDRLDSEAQLLGLSRNQMLTVILRDYYNSKDNLSQLNNISNSVNRAYVIKDNPDMYTLSPEGQYVSEEWKKVYKEE